MPLKSLIIEIYKDFVVNYIIVMTFMIYGYLFSPESLEKGVIAIVLFIMVMITSIELYDFRQKEKEQEKAMVRR